MLMYGTREPSPGTLLLTNSWNDSQERVDCPGLDLSGFHQKSFVVFCFSLLHVNFGLVELYFISSHLECALRRFYYHSIKKHIGGNQEINICPLVGHIVLCLGIFFFFFSVLEIKPPHWDFHSRKVLFL